jgi:hypothetical protein
MFYFEPYKCTVVLKLQDADCVARGWFCNWWADYSRLNTRGAVTGHEGFGMMCRQFGSSGQTIFWSATMNSETQWTYFRAVLRKFKTEKGSWLVHHDGATDPTARHSVTALRNIFVNRTFIVVL